MAKDSKPQEPRSRGIDAPKCKICGYRHWSREPHIFGTQKAVAVAKDRVKQIEKSPIGKTKKKT